MPIPFKIFIAYSHNDATLLEELRKHLRPLERTGKVVIWYDGKIEPGAVWEEDIKKNLHSADLILPLVSADAINSDYFYEKEVADALKRHERGEARVVPLILRPCVWKTTPLKDLQALPKNGKAVTTWEDRDSAWNDAVEALWRYVEAREQQLEAAEKHREADARHQSDLEKQHLEALAREQAETQRQQQAAAAKKQREENQRQAAAEAKERQRLLDEAAQKKREETERQRLQAIENQRAEKERKQREAAERRAEGDKKPFGRRQILPYAVLVSAIILAFYIFKTCSGSGKDDIETNPTQPDTTTLTVITDNFPDTTKSSVPIEAPPKADPPKTKAKTKAKTKPAEKPAEKKEETKAETPASRKSGLEMVSVKGGTFTMGDANGDDDECPHSVTVGSFSIGKYEITQADWKAVMGGFPKEQGNPNCDQCPVERVSWDDIQGFLKKANAKYGKAYRLPTEAEWEYAARGGSRSNGYTYSGSNSPGSVAWFDGNSGSKTHPVGEKADNELGLHDMSGNVWEWCADLWKAYPGCTADECNNCRVLRGGAWFLRAAWLRPAGRGGGSPAVRDGYGYGFRVAQD